MMEPLWKPSEKRVKESNMYRFMQSVNHSHGTNFADYDALYQWSVENLEAFWTEVWRFAGIKPSIENPRVIDDPTRMPGAHWFPETRLNFAENLLRYRDDKTALIFRGEDAVRRTLTYEELYAATAKVAASLRAAGVVPGDRVVGFMPNMPESIIAMLAATSLGATWSSCSPDFGIRGVLDRFGQTRPKVLFTADGYYFKGKALDCLEKVALIIKDLPSIEKIVVVPYTQEKPDLTALPNAVHYNEFIHNDAEDRNPSRQLPLEHPSSSACIPPVRRVCRNLWSRVRAEYYSTSLKS